MAGGHGMYKILGRNVGSQYVQSLPYADIQLTLQLVLGTWAVTFGAVFLATRKKGEKKLNEGPAITASTADPEEAKFIEYSSLSELIADW